MRIAKYLLLLMILFAVALLVFVFTQEGNYKINKSIIVKNLDQKTVYNYIEDLNNWQEFIYDSKNLKVLNKNKLGWKNQKYIVKQKFPNDSILMIYNKDNNEALLNITLKKLKNATKINWNIEGKYTYKEKFLALFYGNNNKNLTQKINNYLVKINNNLYKEHFFYNIKYDKIITLPEQTYIFKIVNCSISNQVQEIENQLKKLKTTLDSVKIKTNKTPFLIYNWLDTGTQNTQFKVCIEIPKFSDTLLTKKQVEIKNEIKYQTVIFKGNKKFLIKFWNNYNIELEKRKLIHLKKIGTIERFDEKKLNSIKKHTFTTEFLIPIYQKEAVKTVDFPVSKKNYIPKKQTREAIKTIEKPEIKDVEKTTESQTKEN